MKLVECTEKTLSLLYVECSKVNQYKHFSLFQSQPFLQYFAYLHPVLNLNILLELFGSLLQCKFKIYIHMLSVCFMCMYFKEKKKLLILILRHRISNVASIFNYFVFKGLPYLQLRSSISY